jgi:hypothetical protein
MKVVEGKSRNRIDEERGIRKLPRPCCHFSRPDVGNWWEMQWGIPITDRRTSNYYYYYYYYYVPLHPQQAKACRYNNMFTILPSTWGSCHKVISLGLNFIYIYIYIPGLPALLIIFTAALIPILVLLGLCIYILWMLLSTVLGFSRFETGCGAETVAQQQRTVRLLNRNL